MVRSVRWSSPQLKRSASTKRGPLQTDMAALSASLITFTTQSLSLPRPRKGLHAGLTQHCIARNRGRYTGRSNGSSRAGHLGG